MGRRRRRAFLRAGPGRWVVATSLAPCVVILIVARHSDILTTIAIDAPPSRVWTVLTDTNCYPEWNPMIAGLKGDLVPGAVIENIEGYGEDQTILWPRVLAVRPNAELRWRGRLWGVPLLFVGEHFFLLRPVAGGTMFTQGEHFSGALLWVFDPARLVPAFEGMNVGLKARAESVRDH